jgi:predicted MFS family arabinose efflux permease
MGIRQAGLPLGAALASAALPAVADSAGWRAALFVGGAVALLGAAAFAALYRRPPVRPTAARQAGTRLALLRDPAMVLALLCGVGLISVQCGVGLLTVLHLHEAASLPPGRAALILVAAQAAGVVGRIGLAAWSDRARSDRQGVVTLSMLAVIGALALLVSPAGRSPVTACVAFVWLGFWGIGWYGPWVALVTEAAPGSRTGFALGLAMAVNQVAIVVVPPLLGLLRDVTGGFAAPWDLLIVMNCLALAAAVGRRARRRGGLAFRP